MEKKELVKGLGYLGIAVGKEYTPEECEVFYDFLKDYNYQTLIDAIKRRIKKSSFPPKINELIEECNMSKNETKLKIVEFMNANGYFKAPVEYEKTLLFLKKGVVPGWLQKDINEYYLKMKKNEVETNNLKQIGGWNYGVEWCS